MSTETESRDMRLHIGSISKQLAEDASNLESRLAKYGKIVRPLELHQKPALETYFGYITIELTPAKYGALKGALNGAKFKGSTLTVAEAKPDWQARWAADQLRKDPPMTEREAIRKYELPRREIDVIPGRERTVRRKNKNMMTVRIFIGRRRKILQCPKKKLWGFMKEKKLDQLVAEYSHGKWRDHHGDIVETVDMKLRTQKKLSQSSTASIPSKTQTNNEEDEEEDEEMKEERDRNLNILQSMFEGGDNNDNDIPAPMKLDDSDESDWERLIKKPSKISTDADFADEYDDYNYIEQESYQEPEAPAAHAKEPTPEPQPELNTTSTLRAMFNPTEEAEPFSLFGGGDEDEEEDIVMNDPIETPAIVFDPAPPPKVKHSDDQPAPRIYAGATKGLFFAHFDSPFLHAQSQVASLAKYTLDKEEWEKEFYDNRGEWNRTLRRRRRDVVRQIQKKNMAKRRTVAI